MTEMDEHWTLADLIDAYDRLTASRAAEVEFYERMQAESRRGATRSSRGSGV